MGAGPVWWPLQDTSRDAVGQMASCASGMSASRVRGDAPDSSSTAGVGAEVGVGGGWSGSGAEHVVASHLLSGESERGSWARLRRRQRQKGLLRLHP